MQRATTNGAVMATVIICAVLLAGAIFLMIPEVPEIPEIPTIPTAEDIAAAITIPTPETPLTELSLREELKREAISVCDAEADFDDIEDLFGSDDFVTIVSEYEDKREYSNVDLGIDNVDDRKIKIKQVFKVEVEPDLADDYKDKVYRTCKVTSDDGELEAKITVSL
jgi:hypothetical protein